jgi:hypothetical protein
MLENEDNDAQLLERLRRARYTAQWNDDVHHGLHVRLTGEARAITPTMPRGRRTARRALAEGFAFQGETMPYRDRPRGSPSAHLPPTAFVAFLQNHDQVGNRAFGERLASLAGAGACAPRGRPAARAAGAAAVHGRGVRQARTPFLYFCDFARTLAPRSATVAARVRALPAFAGPQAVASGSPATSATFEASSKLDCDEAAGTSGAVLAGLVSGECSPYGGAQIVPLASQALRGEYAPTDAWVVRWRPGGLVLVANLGDGAATRRLALDATWARTTLQARKTAGRGRRLAEAPRSGSSPEAPRWAVRVATLSVAGH